MISGIQKNNKQSNQGVGNVRKSEIKTCVKKLGIGLIFIFRLKPTMDRLSWDVGSPPESSWDFDPAQFRDCVQFHPESSDFAFDPEQDIAMDHCCQFLGPERESDPLSFSLGLPESHGKTIHRVILVSEARWVEIYQSDGQYLQSSAGKLLPDSDDEFKIYLIDLTLTTQPVYRLKFKCMGLLSRSCWILACHLLVKSGAKESVKSSSFDCQKINAMLENMELSDKALEFKRVFETMQSTHGSGTGSVPLGGVLPQIMNMAQMSRMSGANGAKTDSNSNGDGKSDTRQELNDRLEAMERRIMNRIDEVKLEQDRKLNDILDLLQKLTMKT